MQLPASVVLFHQDADKNVWTMVLKDFSKAFDLVDLIVLIEKIIRMEIS